MNRRGFFAALLAPLVAQAFPNRIIWKPRSLGMTTMIMESTAKGAGDYLSESPTYEFGWTGFKGGTKCPS
jgi:hypothetical protein